jgi:hypothetical protein
MIPAILALLFVLLMGKERLSESKSFQMQDKQSEEAQ